MPRNNFKRPIAKKYHTYYVMRRPAGVTTYKIVSAHMHRTDRVARIAAWKVWELEPSRHEVFIHKQDFMPNRPW